MKVIRSAIQISRLGTVSSQKPISNRLVLLNQAHLQQNSFRGFSAENPKPKNFFTTFVDTLKDELQKNKDLQEHKKILNERLKELNEADALKEARQKFNKVEQETAQSTEVIRHRVKEFKDHFEKVVTDLQKTDAGKKLSVAGQEALKQAKVAAEFLEKTAKDIGDTQVYQQVSSTAKSVQREIDNIADVRMYSRPQELKMRSADFSTSAFANRTVEANDEATDVELHKESRWYQGWKNFSENNSYYNKVLDWKIRYDESENLAVRLLRGVTERVGSVFSSSNEVSEVLTEIAKIDPKFDKTEWLRFCEKEVIPNVLEAFIRGDLKVLEDWCHERAFVMLSSVIKEYQKSLFTTSSSRIIDISKVEMVSGKMMDQGPVIVITFQVFMINVVKNADGKVIQGDPNKPVRVHHVWVMCRDMEEYNPATAWKLLELHMQEGALAV
uniref:Mitochondrial import inner membrane translocase subunit TIM44 n=1 Tax=Panagrolaimus sp. ES5 TaxID=591445 RepID=A0AC34F717_9BILA